MSVKGVKTIVSVFAGFIAHYLGGFDLLLKVCLTLTVLDFLTGVLGGAIQGKLSSKYGFKGIAKKVMMYCIIALAVQIEIIVGDSVPIRDITVIFYIVNEALSILENGGKVITYPNQLKSIIEQLNEGK